MTSRCATALIAVATGLVFAIGCGISEDRPTVQEFLRKEVRAVLEERVHLLVVHEHRCLLIERPLAKGEGADSRSPLSGLDAGAGLYDKWMDESSDVACFVEELATGRYSGDVFYVLPLGDAQDDTLAVVENAIRECKGRFWPMPAVQDPWSDENATP